MGRERQQMKDHTSPHAPSTIEGARAGEPCDACKMMLPSTVKLKASGRTDPPHSGHRGDCRLRYVGVEGQQIVND